MNSNKKWEVFFVHKYVREYVNVHKHLYLCAYSQNKCKKCLLLSSYLWQKKKNKLRCISIFFESNKWIDLTTTTWILFLFIYFSFFWTNVLKPNCENRYWMVRKNTIVSWKHKEKPWLPSWSVLWHCSRINADGLLKQKKNISFYLSFHTLT